MFDNIDDGSASKVTLSFLSRLVLMVSSWGSIGIVYTLSGLRGAKAAHLLTPSSIDLWFPFTPSAIWVYMSFFLFIPIGFFCAQADRVKWLSCVMVFSAMGAAVVFGFFPTTMVFPEVTQQGLSAQTLKLLMRYDAVVNCLPSLHVTLTCLALLALLQAGHLWRNLLLMGWAVMIMVSILPLHRHQFVDLLAGLGLALLACASTTIFKRYGIIRWGGTP